MSDVRPFSPVPVCPKCGQMRECSPLTREHFGIMTVLCDADRAERDGAFIPATAPDGEGLQRWCSCGFAWYEETADARPADAPAVRKYRIGAIKPPEACENCDLLRWDKDGGPIATDDGCMLHLPFCADKRFGTHPAILVSTAPPYEPLHDQRPPWCKRVEP